MSYLFVLDTNGGWWLKVNNVDELINYHRHNLFKYESALELYREYGSTSKILSKLDANERIQIMDNKDFKLLQAAEIAALKYGGSILDGFIYLNMESGLSQYENLKQYGSIYINRNGGSTCDLEYTQFCRRKNLVFPEFSTKDIRITKFKNGTHYYAYVGDVQVRDGDILKWDTQDDAYSAAITFFK